MKNFPKLLICVIGCELVGLLGTPFTINSISNWYQYLNKPSFSPPNWVFGPVWTVLYLLMGISVFIIWTKKPSKDTKRGLTLFTLQLLFNFTWTILFFGLHNPLLGLINIIVLWILILMTTLNFYKTSKKAGYLLIPYLLWVSFATFLNLGIVILN